MELADKGRVIFTHFPVYSVPDQGESNQIKPNQAFQDEVQPAFAKASARQGFKVQGTDEIYEN
jgi:hypothetical protein